MARTPPIPAEQPLDAAWKAAGQVVTLRQACRGGGRAGGSLLHAGRTAVAADPRSPRNGWPGQRAGPMAAAAPAPGAAGGRGHARIGRCRTGRDGARRPAGGGARGRCDHAGGRGGVRAPGPLHRRHGAGRPRSGADARRGAGRAAGADAVPGGDRNQGVHQPGRGRPGAGPAAAARRGRRGASGLPPGGVRGRAVPHARAGRPERASPVTRSWHAGTVRWWPRPAPAPATCTSGSPPGTWASRCWRGCGPGLRRCSPSPPTPRSPTGTIPDGPAGGTRSSHAGRPRCRPRCGRTRPPTTRQSAASSGKGRRWTSGASTSWPGFPRATRPSRSGSPTSASTPAPRCCWPG